LKRKEGRKRGKERGALQPAIMIVRQTPRHIVPGLAIDRIAARHVAPGLALRRYDNVEHEVEQIQVNGHAKMPSGGVIRAWGYG
jgi:hypothetical protein